MRSSRRRHLNGGLDNVGALICADSVRILLCSNCLIQQQQSKHNLNSCDTITQDRKKSTAFFFAKRAVGRSKHKTWTGVSYHKRAKHLLEIGKQACSNPLDHCVAPFGHRHEGHIIPKPRTSSTACMRGVVCQGAAGLGVIRATSCSSVRVIECSLHPALAAIYRERALRRASVKQGV